MRPVCCVWPWLVNVYRRRCDDVPMAELHTPPISVVSRAAGEIGREAAVILLSLMSGVPAPADPLLLPIAFQPRESSLRPL